MPVSRNTTAARLIALLACLAGVASMAESATITVRTLAQDSLVECTITNAILSAETDTAIGGCTAGSGADVIRVPAGTYTLTTPAVPDFNGDATAFPIITTPIIIEGDGPAQTVIERHPGAFFLFRFFRIRAPAFEIRNLALVGGDVSSYYRGGALFTEDNAVTVRNVLFQNNKAVYGGALGDVGYFGTSGAEFTIEDSFFIGNSATVGGGAIKVSNGGTLTVHNTRFEANVAGQSGGAIQFFGSGPVGSGVDVSDSEFLRNTARDLAGGAIEAWNVRLTRVILRENSARDDGGAVNNYSGLAEFYDSTFVDNQARRGGAVTALGQLIVSGTTFAANEATQSHGGAIFLDDRTGLSRISNSTFSGNRAVDRGGAIGLYQGGLTAINVTATGNVSWYGPGFALFWSGYATLRVSNSIVAGNATTDGVPRDIQADRSEDLISLGHNLIGSVAGTGGAFTLPSSSDLVGVAGQPLDPGLFPLSPNGGPTDTHRLGPTSLALDAGSTAQPGTDDACEVTDQRGRVRPGPGTAACDIGAFEHGITHPLILTVSDGGSVDGFPGATPCTGTCSAILGVGTVVTLTAQPDAGMAFTLWTGACTGSSPSCVVTMDGGKNATATFAAAGGDTTTTLTSSPNPSEPGEAVTFTAVVAPAPPAVGTPTGTVMFLETTTVTVLGTVTLDATGTAIITTSALPAGLRVVSALYARQGLFDSSTDTVSQTVGVPINVAPSFSVPAFPPAVNEDSGLQTIPNFATVLIVGPARESSQAFVGFTVSEINTIGDLAFTTPPVLALDGMLTYEAAADTNGFATFRVTLQDDGGTASGGQDTSAPQTFTITVNAVNDPPSFSVAVMAPLVFAGAGLQTVPNFATALSVGPGNESAQALVGFTVTQTASTGGLTFATPPALDLTGALNYATAANVTGSATFSVTLADDGGTENGGDSTSEARVFAITANAVPTTTTLTSSANPVASGQPVTLTATVAAVAAATGTPTGLGVPTGIVRFIDTGTGEPLGTASLDATGTGTLQLTLSAVGAHSIAANYEGDSTHLGSSSTLTQVMNAAATTTTLTSSPNPTVSGETLTLTAVVSAASPGGGIPAGTVAFVDSTTGVSLGTSTLDHTGTARLLAPVPQRGAHIISATYSGHADHLASGTTATHQVNPAQTTITLLSSPNPSTAGDSIILTARVAVPAPGSGIPTGTVRFVDTTNSTMLGSAVLNAAATAMLTTSALPAGTLTIQVTYEGDASFAGSNTTASQVVTPAPVTLSLSWWNDAGTITDSSGVPLCPPAPGTLVNCSLTVESGSVKTILARTATGAAFMKWTGDCEEQPGSGCTLTMDRSRSATATFGYPVTLHISRRNNGDGTVVPFESSPACDFSGSDRRDSCTINLAAGPLTLTAFPAGPVYLFGAPVAPASRFVAWDRSAPCGVRTGRFCTFTLTGPVAVTATFGLFSPPPLARISRLPSEGSIVRFSGASSTGSSLTYQWSLGTHSGTDVEFSATMESGSHTVTLTVTDVDDISDTATHTFRVDAEPEQGTVAVTLVRSGTGSGSVSSLDCGAESPCLRHVPGGPVTFTAVPSGGGFYQGTPVFPPSKFVEWIAPSPCVDRANPICTFALTGPATLRAQFDLKLRPVPRLTQVPTQGDVVQFSAAGSTDPEGSPLTYQWTLGSQLGTGIDFTATVEPGRHTVVLRVTDDDGMGNTASHTFTVASRDPNAGRPPIARIVAVGARTITTTIFGVPIRAEVFSATGPQTMVTLSGAGSSDPGGGPLTYQWSLGSQSGTSVSFQPTVSLGPHQVSLRVTDAEGLSGSAVFAFEVRDTDAPRITLTSSIVEAAPGTLGAPVSAFGPRATDAISVSALSCRRDTSSWLGTVPLGNQRIRCTASDSSGNESQSVFQVTVRASAALASATTLESRTTQTAGATKQMLQAASSLIALIEQGRATQVCPTLVNFKDAVMSAAQRRRIYSADGETLWLAALEFGAVAGCSS